MSLRIVFNVENGDIRMHPTLVAKVHALEASAKAHQSPVHWRVHGGRIERGFEIGGRGGYICWVTVPFLSTFLLELRRDELALADDGVPY